MTTKNLESALPRCLRSPFDHAPVSGEVGNADVVLTVRQFLLICNPALSIKGIVLGQIESDVLVESANDVFLDVELIDEPIEDLALDGFGRGLSGAVAGVCAGIGEGAGIQAWCSWCSESEEGGQGGEGCEDG